MTTKTLGTYLRNLFWSLIKRKQEYMKLKDFLSLIQDEEAEDAAIKYCLENLI